MSNELNQESLGNSVQDSCPADVSTDAHLPSARMVPGTRTFKPPITSSDVDISSSGEVRPAKPCCLRIEDAGGFCLLVDKHDGICVGRPNVEPIEPTDFGPNASKARRW